MIASPDFVRLLALHKTVSILQSIQVQACHGRISGDIDGTNAQLTLLNLTLPDLTSHNLT